jgi:hypothetical protein
LWNASFDFEINENAKATKSWNSLRLLERPWMTFRAYIYFSNRGHDIGFVFVLFFGSKDEEEKKRGKF